MEPFRTIDFKVELALNKLVFLALVKANPQLKALARNAYLSMRYSFGKEVLHGAPN